MLLPGEVLTKLVFVRKSAEVIVVTGNEPKPKKKTGNLEDSQRNEGLNDKLLKIR
jgi:hypothetical protein